MNRRVDGLMGRIAELKCRKSTKTTPTAPQNDPKTRPKRPQDGQKSDPERQDDKRIEPRRSWDRLGPPQGRSAQFSIVRAHPWGAILGAKTDPKTIQNRSENSRGQKIDPRRSWTRLGAILGRLGCHLGPTWTSKSCCGCSGARFSEKSLFRC